MKLGLDWKVARASIVVAAVMAPLTLPTLIEASNSSSSGNAVATCCLVALAIIAIVNVGLTIWLLNDAHARGVSPGAWIIVFILFGPLGLLGYMLTRPRGKLVPCPECGRQKPILDQICPHCGRRVV